MNEDRNVVAETPDLSHWDLQDEELDRATPARATIFPSMSMMIPCKGGSGPITS